MNLILSILVLVFSMSAFANESTCPKGKRVVSCVNVNGHKSKSICWPKGLRLEAKKIEKKCKSDKEKKDKDA